MGFWFASPVDIKVIAPDGNYITKNENNITGAIYDSVDDPLGFKMVTIENPIEGDYKIELTGIGEGGEYHFASALFGEKDIIQDTAGAIKPGQKIVYDVQFNTDNSLKLSTQDLQPDYLIEKLIKDVSNFYAQKFIYNFGIKISLIAHLEAVENKINKLEQADEKEYNKNKSLAVNRLQQFIDNIKKYRDKFIYEEAADYLIEKTNFIINNL